MFDTRGREVIKVTGQNIWDALENGVSLYPAQEGRFPQTSSIEFEFDPAKEPGKRITQVEVDGEPIDLEKVYVLCTRGYMARGKGMSTTIPSSSRN